MPSYVVEFDSNHGPERRLFTLDDDRTLEVQLYQVLEELRQSGRVLQGAPGDELAVSWNGAELNLRTPMHALAVDSTRPLVLRMRPRPVDVKIVAARARYGLKHILLPPVEGALGGLGAWAIACLLTDATPPILTDTQADVAIGILLAGTIGIALALGNTMRGLGRAPVAAVCALFAALAGALMLLARLPLNDAIPSSGVFVLARVAGWALLAIGVSLVLTAPFRPLGSQRFVEATAIGLFGGVLSALVASLPGVSNLWQAVACILCGAMVGGGAVSIPVWRTNLLGDARSVR
jgi:hypothetical protein